MESRVWTQVTLAVPGALEDAVSDFLTTLTGRGVCLRERDGSTVIDAYLEPERAEENLILIEKHLQDLVGMGKIPQGTRYEFTQLPEEDWMAVFRSQHTTVRVSDRLVIRPTWCDPTGGRELVLDPGMAFGTGSHATTRMCLTLLDECAATQPPGRMFDLGTGSGILAIAGAFLGIRDVLAVDIDAVAVQVASGNVLDNRVEHSVRVVEGGIETAEGLYDMITANLSASLLKRLCTEIVNHLAPGGNLVISGLLEEENKEVLEGFIRRGLAVKKVMTEKVWVAASLVSPEGNE